MVNQWLTLFNQWLNEYKKMSILEEYKMRVNHWLTNGQSLIDPWLTINISKYEKTHNNEKNGSEHKFFFFQNWWTKTQKNHIN